MIDETSMHILNILQEKARIPNVEVSRMVGLAPSAVLERIRKMEKNGTIDGYEVRLNPERFGGSLVSFIHVYLSIKEITLDEIGERLSQILEVQEVHYISGEDCYLVKIRTADTVELNDLLKTKILSIPGVAQTKTTTVLETFKETANIPIKSSATESK